jgi:hypothetical protein
MIQERGRACGPVFHPATIHSMITPPGFHDPVRGPSFSLPIRVVTTLIALVVIAGTLRWWELPASGGWLSQQAAVFFVTLFGTIGAGILTLRSITVVDADGIRQTGLINRNVSWNQMASARMAHWGATRLVVRREGVPFYSVFHGGTPELRAAFGRVAAASRS